jgi:hypothetical protein
MGLFANTWINVDIKKATKGLMVRHNIGARIVQPAPIAKHMELPTSKHLKSDYFRDMITVGKHAKSSYSKDIDSKKHKKSSYMREFIKD